MNLTGNPRSSTTRLGSTHEGARDLRVSPAELQAVKRAGMLTRYALLGQAAFVLVDLPSTGTDGTGLDQPCLTDHHGFVTRGTFSVHHADGRTEAFTAGDAFYVPEGPPTHLFSASADCIVGGFAPVTESTDTSDDALEAQGFAVIRAPGLPVSPPATVRLVGTVEPFQRSGAVDVVGSQMGKWLFMRSRFGPRSGYTSGWCDLPHWGLVLDGEVAISYAGETELASRGDVYFSPPGHRFTSPDGAIVIDYTPISELAAPRVAAWRRAAIAKAPALHMESAPVHALSTAVARGALGLRRVVAPA